MRVETREKNKEAQGITVLLCSFNQMSHQTTCWVHCKLLSFRIDKLLISHRVLGTIDFFHIWLWRNQKRFESWVITMFCRINVLWYVDVRFLTNNQRILHFFMLGVLSLLHENCRKDKNRMVFMDDAPTQNLTSH